MKEDKKIVVTVEDDDGEEHEVTLPSRYEVCDRCHGTGTHTNPAIDGNGITASEWAEWDGEDRENYMSGAYDVMCEDCKGLRVVLCVDEERIEKHGSELEKQALEQYYEDGQTDHDDEYTRQAERGCW